MKKNIIWLSQGRLGNLIFQYQAAFEIANGGWVVGLSSELFDVFECRPRMWVVPAPRRRLGFVRVRWERLWEALVRWGVVGSVGVVSNADGETSELVYKNGFFSRWFVLKGFFQSPQYAVAPPQIKPELKAQAQSRLAAIPRASRVAVHVRLGDYLTWTAFGVPGFSCLPESYYASAIQLINNVVPDAHFIVLSDEPEKALEMIAKLAPKAQVLQGETPADDFAIIAGCSHAILSASTFSWWASTLIDNPSRLLVAPKYWSGFRRRVWMPPTIESSHLTYVDVVP